MNPARCASVKSRCPCSVMTFVVSLAGLHSRGYFEGEYEEFDVGKEIKSVFGWFVYSHLFSLVI